MAGEGDRGVNPQGSHPRMSAPMPQGASETAGQMKEKAQDLISGAAHRLEDAWRGGREQLQEGVSAAVRQAENAWDDVTGMIRRYPVASVAIAFGIGFFAAGVLASVRLANFSDDMTRRMSRSSA